MLLIVLDRKRMTEIVNCILGEAGNINGRVLGAV
jgi:hypothetical protein